MAARKINCKKTGCVGNRRAGIGLLFGILKLGKACISREKPACVNQSFEQYIWKREGYAKNCTKSG